jgi:PII-like signaling protein
VSGDCLVLSTYFGERDRVDGALVADRLLDLYGSRRLRASVLLRGAEGFGRVHHLHSDRLLTLSEDLPLVSLAVDGRERIEALLEEVLAITRRGLVTLERASLVDAELTGARLSERLGEATKLTVFVGRQERVGRAPAFAAVVELLRRHGVAGATALVGVDGTRRGRRQRARFFARNAEVPMMIVAVGSGASVAAALAELRAALREPLFTLERVQVCKRDGELLARPHELPAADARGLGLWQKLTVYTSQAATHGGLPVNLQIIRRLRASEAAGATSVRGTWGYHGEHAPHGDRLLQLRRHVPVVTSVIDTPARIAKAFQTIDELTAEHGLVTSEMVPAASAISAETRSGGTRLASHRY